ncbi:hypothetical protein EON64_12890 [archaeon]|nr:MAG: hypothetical protein EON64_12890 [archaeon]
MSWSVLQADLLGLKEDMKTAQDLLLKHHAQTHATLSDTNPTPNPLEDHPLDSASSSNIPNTVTDPMQRQMQKELMLLASFVRDLTKPLTSLLPSYILQLNELTNITPYTLLSKEEIERRESVTQMTYKLVLKINQQVVTSTKYMVHSELGSAFGGEIGGATNLGHIILPGFVIDYKKYLEVMVYTMPRDLCVDVYCRIDNKVLNSYMHINTIHIPIPSHTTSRTQTHYTHSITAKYGGYSFVSDSLRLRDFVLSKNWCGVGCGVLDICGDDEEGYRRVGGTLYCAIDFDPLLPSTHVHPDGYKSDELALMSTQNRHKPQALIYHSHTDTGSRLTSSSLRPSSPLSQIYDMTREQDFQTLLPEMQSLDVNSPYNDYTLYLKSKRLVHNSQQSFRLTGLDVSEYFQFTNPNLDPIVYETNTFSLCNFLKVKQSLRHKLLVLRVRKPYLFNSPVPLQDAKIETDVNFMNLLHKEYPTDAIYAYSKRPVDGGDEDQEDVEGGGTSATRTQHKVISFLQRVRNANSLVNRQVMKKHYVTSNVVLEVDYSPELIDVQRYLSKQTYG